MTGIQNPFYALALSITRRLVGRSYTPSSHVLAVEADILALSEDTIRRAGEFVVQIEALAAMRRNGMSDRDAHFWGVTVNQTENGWNKVVKPALLGVAPSFRPQADELIAKSETSLRSLRIAGLH